MNRLRVILIGTIGITAFMALLCALVAFVRMFTEGAESPTIWTSDDTGYCIAVSPDQSEFCVGFGCHAPAANRPHEMIVFDSDGKLLDRMEAEGVVGAVAYSKDGREIGAVGQTRLHFWNRQRGQTKQRGGQGTWSIAFSPIQPLIASGGDKDVYLLNYHTDECKILAGHGDWVYSVLFSRDGRFLYSAGKDKTIRIWNAETGIQIAVMMGHHDAVLSLALLADGLLLSGSWDKTIKMWDVNDPLNSHLKKECAILPNAIYSISLSSDKSLLVAAAGIELILFSSDTFAEKKRTYYPIVDSIRGTAFLGNSRVVSVSKNGIVRMWNVGDQ